MFWRLKYEYRLSHQERKRERAASTPPVLRGGAGESPHQQFSPAIWCNFQFETSVRVGELFHWLGALLLLVCSSRSDSLLTVDRDVRPSVRRTAAPITPLHSCCSIRGTRGSWSIYRWCWLVSGHRHQPRLGMSFCCHLVSEEHIATTLSKLSLEFCLLVFATILIYAPNFQMNGLINDLVSQLIDKYRLRVKFESSSWLHTWISVTKYTKYKIFSVVSTGWTK